MKKVLVLGHTGMLGNAVYKYLHNQKDKFLVLTSSERWPDESFKDELASTSAEVIINCIGLIPQTKPLPTEYAKINIELPIFLDTLGKKIIHPSTDCEFSGVIGKGLKYKKTAARDAMDDYGKSKAEASRLIETSFKNTKVIRVSIIGHEERTSLGLLDWFLNSSTEVRGYTNHYWNGITTLEWAKRCENLIVDWGAFPVINQYGTKDIRSKYDLLSDIKNIYNKDINIVPFATPDPVNKCLESDLEIKPIVEQLQELKEFYNK